MNLPRAAGTVVVVGLRDRFRAAKTPQDAFAAEMTRLIRQLLPVRSVEAGPGFSLAITFTDGTGTTMFLDNFFAEAAQRTGDDRNERLRRAVLAMRPAPRPSTWAEARDRLFPAVRAISWAVATAGGSGPDKQPLYRPFLPFLALLTAVDDQYAMSFVSSADLEAWGVDEDTVVATARQNLVDNYVGLARPEGEAWVEVLGPDGYVASWLTAPDVLAGVGLQALDGDFVALAPSRDTLRLVATADRSQLRTELERALAEYNTAPRQLSPVPYHLAGGTVQPWVPPRGDACEPTVERARQVLAAVEYGHQHRRLTSLFEKAEADVYVAQYNLMERRDGSVWSWAVWAKGVTDALLPRTDYLAMAESDSEAPWWVRWDDAVRLAPAALTPEAYDPPRWRESGWPEPAVLDALRAVAVNTPGDEIRPAGQSEL